MRHGKTINHLGRTASHRNAMLSNMASSLILHKRITTTVAKAKALRKFVEPLLTKSKNDTTHSRRLVFSELGNKEVLKELFGTVAARVATRPGGYTRIIKLSQSRLGDNAEMCIIELVDFNETLLEAKSGGEAKASTTRRSRRSGGSKKAAEGTAAAAPVAAASEAAPAPTTEVSAPEDTPTDTLSEGETRDEVKGDESAS
ncbi:50S ribosomal protein L17 [Hymenobacter weizhouensis]|uniref:50S ribosomal protein L17 n=1 Tax=Hymenobacter sp. YIM 151500-1 TaxID=2987689 RepID=UPI0022277638|nr:50S ribosomal protein L17 [Hymenobacter sp. YIM 151500-1]UYZ62911.1 50S ribosomal protein L17 [Hymenobacter sp. YIM 151500-1]